MPNNKIDVCANGLVCSCGCRVFCDGVGHLRVIYSFDYINFANEKGICCKLETVKWWSAVLEPYTWIQLLNMLSVFQLWL